MIYYLTLEQIVLLHNNLIKSFGGETGIRNMDILIAATENPKAHMFYQDVNPTSYDKAACYLYQISRNQPFNDKNSRTAFAVCIMFIQYNWIQIKVDNSTIEKITIDASKDIISQKRIANILELGI